MAAQGYNDDDQYWGTWEPDDAYLPGDERGTPAANYDTREPFVGQNGVPFNYGPPGSETEKINKQNPTGDPGKPYVDTGDTGGSLNGVTTVAQGRSLTQSQADEQKAQALAAGYSESQWNDFLKRNPFDTNRFLEGQTNLTGGASGGAGGFPGSGGGTDALSSFLAYLQQKDASEQAWKTSMREILMGQLQGLQQPVSADDPGIRDVLAGRRIQSQRDAERARLQAAERYASQGLGSSGALTSKLEGIDQQRGEANAQATGQILYQELTSRRTALQNLLQTAIASGDAAAAQNINLQLQAIQSQLQNSQFNDQLGFSYNSLNSGLNSNALLAALRTAGLPV